MLGVEGPFIGKASDIGIFRMKLENKLKEWKETCLADKAYLGSTVVLSPLRRPRKSASNPEGKRSEWQKAYDFYIRSRRVRVERSIGRIKRFSSVVQTWRHPLSKHQQVVRVICKMVNIHLRHQPLFKVVPQEVSMNLTI
jgi:hypothetical protein